MIKITLSNGTVVELDKYEKDILKDLVGFKEKKESVIVGRLCQICKDLISSDRGKTATICDKKLCNIKRKRIYQREWQRAKYKKLKLAEVSKAISVQDVPVEAIKTA